MKIFGIALDYIRWEDLMGNISSTLESSSQQISIFTPNPEILLRQKYDTEFHEILLRASYLTIDGIGLYFAFQALEYRSIWLRCILTPYFFFNIIFRKRYLSQKYGARICGSDLTKKLIEYSSKHSIAIAIVDPYFPHDLKKVAVQKTFVQDLTDKYPDLIFDYYIYKNPKQIAQQIKGSEAKILFSTLGMKVQEQSVMDIMQACPNIKVGLGVGSSFDAITGFQKRCPKIVSNLGVEWLYRIITTPRKLRQLQKIWRAVGVFSWEVIRYRGS